MNFTDFKTDFPSASISYYKVGGSCKYFFFAENDEQVSVVQKFASEQKIVSQLLDNDNFIVSDDGFDGLLIVKRCEDEVKTRRAFKLIPFSMNLVAKLEERGVDVQNIANNKDLLLPSLFIVESGLTGKFLGGFKVSDTDANVIEKINPEAGVDGFMQLISYIKQQVRDNFSLQLEEEFIYIS